MTPAFEKSHGQTHPSHRGRFRRIVIAGAKITGIIFGLAALVHISWNMFAPDMLGLEAIRMKQALGLVVFISVLGFVLASVARFGAGGKHDGTDS